MGGYQYLCNIIVFIYSLRIHIVYCPNLHQIKSISIQLPFRSNRIVALPHSVAIDIADRSAGACYDSESMPTNRQQGE